MNRQNSNERAKAMVGVIMGSDSDLDVMSQAADMLDDLGVTSEVTIVSAHRTPERMFNYARAAEERGLEVIIAGAGGAAHLPGMVASLTVLPVIGVPVRTSALSGVDSLLSIVQMPRGVPVATVAVNNAQNAALLAARILAIKHEDIRNSLRAFAEAQRSEVEAKARALESAGHRGYLGRKRKS